MNELQIAIVTAHTMCRFLKNYELEERTAVYNKVFSRVTKFLRTRNRTNLKDYVFATEYERILWLNATDAYEKDTKIFAIDFISKLHGYYLKPLEKYANLSEKLMVSFMVANDKTTTTDDEQLEIDANDNDLVSTYVKTFEKDSGISLRVNRLSSLKDKYEDKR